MTKFGNFVFAKDLMEISYIFTVKLVEYNTTIFYDKVSDSYVTIVAINDLYEYINDLEWNYD